MNKYQLFSPFIIWGVILSLSLGSATAQQPVNADLLLRDIRLSASVSKTDLNGRLTKRVGRKNLKLPVSLFMRPDEKNGSQNIQFHFKDSKGKASRFHMRLKQKGSDLLEIVNEKTKRFPVAKLGQSIDVTDLTYEDLALRFLYWPNSKILGEEKVGGQKCYKIRVVNPDRKGRYGSVLVWAHKKYHALMKVEGFDFEGKPLKRFEITDIMKVNDVYTLERMRVDSLDPISGRSIGLTYLEFDKPKKKQRRRLKK